MNTNTTAARQSYLAPLIVLTSLFFMWGLITSLNDVLIPHLKAAFSLNYVQVMLVNSCFFGAYFVVSLPAGALVERVGYKTGIIIGLAGAALGCILFYPAAALRSYPFFLGALFVLASGITLLQVAANPYVAVLGSPQTASRRLTLTQAFNSLGTTVGPLLGSVLILAGAASFDAATASTEARVAQAALVQGPYLGLAAALGIIAVLIAIPRLPKIAGITADSAAGTAQHASILGHRHLVLGAVCIFAYVGAEVSIGSFLVNTMVRSDVAGLTPEVAGRFLALYWGGAMVGRFIGAAVMTRVAPARVLACNAAVVVVLLAVAMLASGHVAMWALLGIGLFNSIMFPTIFTLGIAGLGPHTGKGSGLLCMAIVGGAVVPVVQGWFADHASFMYAFTVPLVCYLYIVHYGLKGHRPA